MFCLWNLSSKILNLQWNLTETQKILTFNIVNISIKAVIFNVMWWELSIRIDDDWQRALHHCRHTVIKRSADRLSVCCWWASVCPTQWTRSWTQQLKSELRVCPVHRKERAAKVKAPPPPPVLQGGVSTVRTFSCGCSVRVVPLSLSAASVQQRSQLEELRKFGKEFRVRIIVFFLLYIEDRNSQNT